MRGCLGLVVLGAACAEPDELHGDVIVDGVGLAGVEVLLAPMGPGGDAGPTGRALTDDHGRFVFDDLDPEETYKVYLAPDAAAAAWEWNQVSAVARLGQAGDEPDVSFVGVSHRAVNPGSYVTGAWPRAVSVVPDMSWWGGPPGAVGFVVADDGGLSVHYADGPLFTRLRTRQSDAGVVALDAEDGRAAFATAGPDGQTVLMIRADRDVLDHIRLERGPTADVSRVAGTEHVYAFVHAPTRRVGLRQIVDGDVETLRDVDLTDAWGDVGAPTSAVGRDDDAMLFVDDGTPGSMWTVSRSWDRAEHVREIGDHPTRLRCSAATVQGASICAVASSNELHLVRWPVQGDPDAHEVLPMTSKPSSVAVWGSDDHAVIVATSAEGLTWVRVDRWTQVLEQGELSPPDCTLPVDVDFVDEQTVAVACMGNARLAIARLP